MLACCLVLMLTCTLLTCFAKFEGQVGICNAMFTSALASKRRVCLVQVLFEDKQLQQTIFNKHRDELRSLNDKITEIMVSSPSAVHLARMSFVA